LGFAGPQFLLSRVIPAYGVGMDRRVYSDDNRNGSFYESSTRTPGFLHKRNSGERLPINGYDWIRQDDEHPLSYTYNGWQNERLYIPSFVGCLGSGSLNTGRGDPTVYFHSIGTHIQIAINKALEKSRDTDVDLGVALGEYKQTAEFISKGMIKVGRALRDVRRGRFGSAMRHLTGSSQKDTWRDVPRAAANTWLGITYGLKPLLNDIYGAITAYEKSLKPRPILRTVLGSSKYEVSVEAADAAPTVAYARTFQASGICRAQITYSIDNPLLYTLDQLGLTNPASIAWELVPYSFVVDWFLPIGDYLQNMQPPKGTVFVEGFYSAHVKGETSSRYWAQTPHPGDSRYPDWSTHGVGTGVYKHRRALSSFPSYRPIVPDLSPTKARVASALSLIIQAVTGGRK